jgi:hypothetical protein
MSAKHTPTPTMASALFLRLSAPTQKHIGLIEAQRDVLFAALKKFVTAAKSWHNTHGHGTNPIQCDWLCECIAPGEAALNAARSPAPDAADGEGR